MTFYRGKVDTLVVGTTFLGPIDPYMSTRHFALVRDLDGRVWVEDEGSTNGTWVRVRPGGPIIRAMYPIELWPGVPAQIYAGKTRFNIDSRGRTTMTLDVERGR